MKRIALALFAMLIAGPCLAQDKASLRLNWIIYGFHTPFYLGLQQGIYKRHGIELTIGEGKGSGSTVQVVGSGGDTFGLSDSSSIINGVARGIPVRAVMSITNRSPYTVEVRKDSGITRFQELAGKTLATAPGEAGLVLFPALLAAQNMPPDSVRFLRIDPNAKMVALLQNQVVGMLGGLDNQSLLLPRKGVPIIDFPYSELGVNTVGLCIHASRFDDHGQSRPGAALHRRHARELRGGGGRSGCLHRRREVRATRAGPRSGAGATEGRAVADPEPARPNPENRLDVAAGLGRHAGAAEAVSGAQDRQAGDRLLHHGPAAALTGGPAPGAIVTGGAGGIGRAVMARLARDGFSPSSWDLQAVPGGVAVDVTDADALMRAAAASGPIRALVTNAGILGPVARCWELAPADIRRVIDANLVSAFLTLRAVVPRMLENPGPDRGRIVLMSSLQAKEGTAGAGAYAAAKAGIIALTKVLGQELAPEGILVNAVTPTVVRTSMEQGLTPERRAFLMRKIPLGRFAEPEEVAAMVSWLCGTECSFSTGAVFDLSGGRATA